MTLEAITEPFTWKQYSKKLAIRCTKFFSSGSFTEDEAEKRGFLLLHGSSGDVRFGNNLELFWLIDKEDGTVIDAKFKAYGISALIGCSEAACELVIGKPLQKAFQLSTATIDSYLRDTPTSPAIPMQVLPYVRLIYEAVEEMQEKAVTLPLEIKVEVVPKKKSTGSGPIANFHELSDKEKLACIDAALDEEIRPFVAMDGGGVDVIKLEGDEVSITYSGNCVGCFSATGSTLSAIQEILNERVSPSLRVIPVL